MEEIQNSKHYDLEDRTFEYSKRIIKLCKSLGNDLINRNLANQLIRSGTSMGANYREANETETKKDFQFRIRICRKEGKETVYWVKLVMEANPEIAERLESLLQETNELVKIFVAILEKTKSV
ncbi:MAG: four helix bundle protein [Candidatus Magasanikbacteria bacterium]|nr:four helix bundle protein [Candidatus Magasanikbacteria bacterium]